MNRQITYIITNYKNIHLWKTKIKISQLRIIIIMLIVYLS